MGWAGVMLGLLIDFRNLLFALLLGWIGITFTPPQPEDTEPDNNTSRFADPDEDAETER